MKTLCIRGKLPGKGNAEPGANQPKPGIPNQCPVRGTGKEKKMEHRTIFDLSPEELENLSLRARDDNSVCIFCDAFIAEVIADDGTREPVWACDCHSPDSRRLRRRIEERLRHDPIHVARAAYLFPGIRRGLNL